MSSCKKILYIVCCLLLLHGTAIAQHGLSHSPNDTILLGAVVEQNDTIPMIFLPEVTITGILDARTARRLAKEHDRDMRLRYNVYKVYPYAVIAAGILKDVDVNLDKLPTKREKKAYLKSVERELNSRFKGQLEDLTIEQGQILVRLIDRQAGKNCYSIIRELKGGFSAVIWQSVALLFNNNLKREYDPDDRDKDIETIVREIEASNYYNYEYYNQQLRLHAKAN